MIRIIRFLFVFHLSIDQMYQFVDFIEIDHECFSWENVYMSESKIEMIYFVSAITLFTLLFKIEIKLLSTLHYQFCLSILILRMDVMNYILLAFCV